MPACFSRKKPITNQSKINASKMAKLYFYYSAMDAGKSTALLQANHNYQQRGMRTILLVPDVTAKDKQGLIRSRIGVSAPAYAFGREENLLAYIRGQVESSAESIACVLVDEAQFMTKKQVEQLCDIVDLLNIAVCAYGLRTDFRTEPFEGSLYLLSWADHLGEVKTMCHCGKKATMTLRVGADGTKLEDGPQVQIGGNELYVSVCRRHHRHPATK